VGETACTMYVNRHSLLGYLLVVEVEEEGLGRRLALPSLLETGWIGGAETIIVTSDTTEVVHTLHIGGSRGLDRRDGGMRWEKHFRTTTITPAKQWRRKVASPSPSPYPEHD